MIARIFQILALTFLSTACLASTTDFAHLVKPKQNAKADCNTADSYTYAYKYEGYYKGYASTIHSQVKLTSAHYSADDIAMIGYLVQEVTRERFPHIDSWKYQAMSLMMSHTQVIVAKDFKHMQKLWRTPSKKKLRGRTTRSMFSCFQVENNTWFYTILEKKFKTTDTVVHEAMHTAAQVITGNSQVNHDDPRFWDELDPKNSLQVLVERRFKEEKGSTSSSF